MKKKIPIFVLLIAAFAAFFLLVRFSEKKPERETTSYEACVIRVYEKSVLCYIAQTNPHRTDLCSFGIDSKTEILDENGKRTKKPFCPGQMLLLEVDVPIQYTSPTNYPQTARVTFTGRTDEALLRKGEEKALLLGGSE